MTKELNDQFYVGAYWGARPESVDRCSKRLQLVFEGLAGRDSLFKAWYLLGEPKARFNRDLVDVSEGGLRELLLAGQNRRDADGSVIEQLGFGLDLCTGGKEGRSASLSARCGGSSDAVGVLNSCVLRLPDEGESAEKLLEAEVLQDLVSLVVRCLDPEWAVVTSYEYTQLTRLPRSKSAPGGWLLYLPVAMSDFPRLPEGATLVEVPGFGAVVSATRERFFAARPDHLEVARAVAAALGRARLLPME